MFQRISLVLFATLLYTVSIVHGSVPPVYWAIHPNCDESIHPGIHAAIEVAVSVAKARSKLAAEALNNQPPDPKVVTLVKLLLGEDGWEQKLRDSAELFGRLEALRGPVDLQGGIWNLLARTNDHWRNIVFYCRPEFRPVQNAPGRLLDVSSGLEVAVEDLRFTIYEEIASGSQDFDAKAETSAHWLDEDSPGRTPLDERTIRVPETITFHPNWLLFIQGHDYNGFTDDKLKKATSTEWPRTVENLLQVMNLREDPADVTPIDALCGFECTIHHELFHTTVFGEKNDMPDKLTAYGWSNVVEHKHNGNAENFMFLALAIEIVGKGYNVDLDGSIHKL